MEVFWRQCSRVSWLKEGDRNTKYFHAKASSRRKRNSIIGLFDDNGVWMTLEGIIGRYFSSIFESSRPSEEQMVVVLETVEARLPINMRDSLDVIFTADEVRCASFQMCPSKAPGEDGFPAKIFKNNQNWTTNIIPISSDLFASG